ACPFRPMIVLDPSLPRVIVGCENLLELGRNAEPSLVIYGVLISAGEHSAPPCTTSSHMIRVILAILFFVKRFLVIFVVFSPGPEWRRQKTVIRSSLLSS